MSRNSRKKSWGEMTAVELAQATKEFDHPLPASRFKPLTKAGRERFERAARAGDAGRQLLKALRLDPKLVKEAEAYAEQKKLTVSEIFERGLRRELAVRD